MAEISPNGKIAHSVFNRPALQTPKNQDLFGKGLTLSKMTNFRLFQTENFTEDNITFD